jgi:hypothetical protein
MLNLDLQAHLCYGDLVDLLAQNPNAIKKKGVVEKSPQIIDGCAWRTLIVIISP